MHSCFAFDKKRRTKRVLSLALALALVFSAVAFLPQTVNAATTGTVTASALNVRSGPGTNYASLGLLRRGTSVTVESVSGGWAQISFNGKTAYVSAEYVSMSASQPSDGSQTTGGETVSGTATVTASSLNLRSGPGTNYARIGGISRGASVTLLEKSGSWYKISYNGTQGYVSAEYLSIASAPAAPETPATPSSSTTATVTASALNVRTGPGTNYAVITTVARSTQVTVTEKGASWSLISINNRTGYVSNEYLAFAETPAQPEQPAEPEQPSQPEQPAEPEQPSQPEQPAEPEQPAQPEQPAEPEQPAQPATITAATINASALYIRVGAGTNYTALALAYRGETVTVLEKGDSWSRVTTQRGVTGYASNDYLTFVSSSPVTTVTATVTASSLNFRTGPGTGYGSMGYISRGQTVTVTEKGDSWCKITYNGKTGYVSTQYLSFASSGNTGSDAATPSTTYPYDAYCTASSLNIRSGAGTGYPCIGSIPYGAQMSVVGEAGDGWLKITYGGVTGCVSAQYVSTTKPSSSGGNNSTSGGGSGYDYTPPEGLTGTAAENIIAIAASQIGYQEGYNNDTKYGIAFGMNHQPWCHMFVWWCARQAGISSSVIPTTAHCPSGLDWFRSYAIYHSRGDGYTPQPGDIIYFTWRSGSVSHVGIVEKVVGNTVYTIEGNTSDRVARRSYSLSSSTIVGYGVPAYNW